MVEVKQDELFEAIAHGDEEHRAWLKATINDFFRTRLNCPSPPTCEYQSAFAAGRASVLSELESPTEAMIEAAQRSRGCQFGAGETYQQIFTAMIRAYKDSVK